MKTGKKAISPINGDLFFSSTTNDKIFNNSVMIRWDQTEIYLSVIKDEHQNAHPIIKNDQEEVSRSLLWP